jgi:ABC-type sulfate transport system permease component
MENSILYTFSTIAQALGGAFALLSAFVLFRFQSLDASMLNASVGLRSIWKTPADLETYDTLRGLSVWPSLNKAIDAQIARMTAAHEEPSFEVMATKTRLRAGQSLHRVLSLAFWVAVLATFLVMTGSVAVIPYAHEIAEAHSVKFIHSLNLAGIAAFAVCMVSYVFVIYAALVSRYGKHIIQPRIEELIKGR